MGLNLVIAWLLGCLALCPCRARELPPWLDRVSRVALSIFVLPLLCDCDWLPLRTRRCLFASTLLYPVVSRSLYHHRLAIVSPFPLLLCLFALRSRFHCCYCCLLPPGAWDLGPGPHNWGPYFNGSRQLFVAAPLTSLHLNSPHLTSPRPFRLGSIPLFRFSTSSF